MADLARSIEGSMIISVNNHPAMRQAFDGLRSETTAISYTVGGGRGSEASELVIWNENAELAPSQPTNKTLF